MSPCDYSKYPPDWQEIRTRILKRADYKCEWCGAENYALHPITGSKVILTIAHLDHDPENWQVTDDRLAALCQKCHLRYDKQATKEEGQIFLWEIRKTKTKH